MTKPVAKVPVAKVPVVKVTVANVTVANVTVAEISGGLNFQRFEFPVAEMFRDFSKIDRRNVNFSTRF